MYHVVTPTVVSLYRPDDTGGAAHLCAAGHTTYDKLLCILIHDVNPSQLSGAFHRCSEEEALLDARRDTVTHRATIVYCIKITLA